MNDCLDNPIAIGDIIAVVHSGGTNSTMLLGVVEATSDSSVKFVVHHNGKRTSYTRHPAIGEIRTVMSPHRVLIVEEANG